MRAPEFWGRDGAAARLLAPLGAAFALAGHLRRRLARPWRAPVPVICIGNLTTGGTGKTPTAIHVALRLRAQGLAPHILTRGHGGRAAGPLAVDPLRHDAALVGDEALLLARAAPTWVARDRAAGARAAVVAGAGVLVMDDGFQNPGLVQDLALVVIDGATGFGNGRVLPAGPLREPLAQGLARASAFLLVGPDRAGVRARLPAEKEMIEARLEIDAEGLAGRTAIAFAGIGRPAKFFEALQAAGVRLLATRGFADHHRFRPGEILPLIEQATRQGALLLTTEKDAVRLPAGCRHAVRPVAVRLVPAEPGALDRLLEAAIRGRAHAV